MSAELRPQESQGLEAGTGLGGMYASHAGLPQRTDMEALDVALLALAAECREMEPDPRLGTQIAHAARVSGLLGNDPLRRGLRSSMKLPAWWWSGIRASGVLAAAAVVALVLWLPVRLTGPNRLDLPTPGQASVPSAPTVPQPGQAARATASEPPRRAPKAHSARDAELATARVSNLETRPPVEQLATPAAAMVLPSPAMQWPPEVLAAAQRMAHVDRGWAEGSGTLVELPLESVRVRMGADELWRMGLGAIPAARSQAVLADFLVSEEGRPLAVRLVGVYP